MIFDEGENSIEKQVIFDEGENSIEKQVIFEAIPFKMYLDCRYRWKFKK
ncbi:hypothetical protein [Lacinutrix sp. MEBiC02595]